MNLKQINYKYRSILQISIFVLFLIIFIGILIWDTNHIRNVRHLSIELQKWETIFATNHNLFKNILVHTPVNDPLYLSGENNNTKKFESDLLMVADSLDILLTSAISHKETLLYDSLINSLGRYRNLYIQSVLAFREIGTSSTGKTATLLSFSKELINLLQGTGLPGLCTISTELSYMQSEYLQRPGIIKYNEITSTLEAISNDPSLTTDFAGEILESIRKYKTELEELDNAWKRYSTGGDQALNVQMENSFLNTLELIRHIRLTLGEKRSKRLDMLVFISIILTTIFALIYLFLYISFSKHLAGPLQNSIDYSYNLSKGKIPDNQIATINIPPEISLLNQNLNKMAGSISDKKHFIESLLKQKFDIDLELQGKNDSFGKTLIALKENMRKAKEEQNRYAEENKARRYMNEGIAKFSDILRNNSNNLDQLSDSFIREIVKYLEAIQGGLFLLDSNEENLELKAAFAYNRKKFITKTIRKGESLVGTCALEKKTIKLNNIPEEYIEITSGLGDAPPRNLLILPAIHEGQLLGVIEIAALHDFNPDQVSLSEKLASNLASTIITARINTKTSELLQKSQQQAAEMTEQEEEMRQNMEELKATQEESARREEELEGILNAISQSFYLLEYDIEGVITKANQRFLDLTGMPLEKIIGMKHTQLFGKGSKATSSLFAKVTEGISVELSD